MELRFVRFDGTSSRIAEFASFEDAAAYMLENYHIMELSRLLHERASDDETLAARVSELDRVLIERVLTETAERWQSRQV